MDFHSGDETPTRRLDGAGAGEGESDQSELFTVVDPPKRPRRRAAASASTPPSARRRSTALHHVAAPQSLVEAVEELARLRGCELSALLNAALLLGRDRLVAAAAENWESGPVAQLSLRLPVGLTAAEIVGALRLVVRMSDAGRYDLIDRNRGTALAEAWGQERAVLATRLEQLSQAVEKLAFRPLSGGVRTPRHAAYILGFPDEVGLSEAVVTARFRQVAPLYHPDTGVISNGQQRVAQIIEARRVLLESLRRR